MTNDTFAVTGFDDEGIAVTNYRYHDIGPQYTPAQVALNALSTYNAYQEALEERHLNAFRKHAKWLIATFVDKGEWGVWHYRFDFISPSGRCVKPWASSLAQGLGISTLVRYDSLFREAKALDIARKALAAYDVPIDRGGVLRVDDRGLKWYEEYACPGAGSVLNGFIFSLIGAKEWYDYTGDPRGQEKFDSGMETLKRSIEAFELRLPLMRWTRYDNHFVIHSDKYHDLHVKQLQVLLELCAGRDTEFLRRHYDKWKSWQQRYGRSRLFPMYRMLCRGVTVAVSSWPKRSRPS